MATKPRTKKAYPYKGKLENFRKLGHHAWGEMHADINKLAELVTRKNYGRRISYTNEEVMGLLDAREGLAKLVRGSDFYLARLTGQLK